MCLEITYNAAGDERSGRVYDFVTPFVFFSFVVLRRRPRSTPFPYTTLFRSRCPGQADLCGSTGHTCPPKRELDRKSTRLNSSHGYSSYAVFCLKKKMSAKYLGNNRHS